MNGAIEHIDKALRVAGQEWEALRSGDVDAALALADERAELIALACEIHPEADSGILAEKFALMRELQEGLTQEVADMREAIRTELNQARNQSRRLAGYRKAAAHAG